MADAAYQRYEKSKRQKKKHQIKKSNPLQVHPKDDPDLVNQLR